MTAGSPRDGAFVRLRYPRAREFPRQLLAETIPAITSATLALAENRGFDMVAEGVETEQQVQQKKDLGCSLHQGFFKPALPPEEFEAWLSALR